MAPMTYRVTPCRHAGDGVFTVTWFGANDLSSGRAHFAGSAYDEFITNLERLGFSLV